MRRAALPLALLLGATTVLLARADGDGGGGLGGEDDTVLVYGEDEPRAGEPVMPIIEVPVDDPAIVEAATWAVGHLAGLSDSGVYTSLSLVSIDHAATQEGVFHDNTLLTVTLASPHFLDGVPTSTHRIIVMADQDDGVRSFAIDEFPVMEPDAVEAFWVRKVEAGRAARALEFEALEEEYAAHYDEICEEDRLRRGGSFGGEEDGEEGGGRSEVRSASGGAAAEVRADGSTGAA